jgi:hypothetical protein
MQLAAKGIRLEIASWSILIRINSSQSGTRQANLAAINQSDMYLNKIDPGCG